MNEYVVAFTGHRPNKLGGYHPSPLRAALRDALRTRLSELRAHHPGMTCISGMALGFDQWAAEVCVELAIPFEAAVPFVGQEARWPLESRKTYQALLDRAGKVTVVCPGGYSAASMQRRNAWMVDHCDHLVGAWDGSAGGTANCWYYAQRVSRSRENLLDGAWFKPFKALGI